MSLRSRAARGGFWSATEVGGTSAATSLIFIALSRLLQPEDFGLVALSMVVVAFAAIFLDLGFSDAIVQRSDLEPEHLDTAFWSNLLVGIVLTAVTLGAAGPIAEAFGQSRLAHVIRWASLSFVLGALASVQKAILKRRLDYRNLALPSLVASISAGAVAVIMAIRGYGVWSLVTQFLIQRSVETVMLWNLSEWRPRVRFSVRHAKPLWAFGLNIVGSRFVDFFSRRSDDLVIGFFLGPAMLGYYTVAYRLLGMLTRLLIRVTNSVAFSAFSRLQDDPDRMRTAFYMATQFTSLFAIPAFVAIVILAPELTPLLFGAKWIPSVPVMQILAFVGILHSITYFNGSVIKAAGRPAWRLGILSINAICNVLAFMIVVRWGIVAIAGAYVAVGYLLAPLSFVAVRKLIMIEYGAYLRRYLVPAGGSVLMALSMLLTSSLLTSGSLVSGVDARIRVMACMAVGAVIYWSFVYLAARPLSRLVGETLRLAMTAPNTSRT